MAQRIYWVPHTICFLGCEHCHNDSRMGGVRANKDVIDKVIANLPETGSAYSLEEVLVGGGEALMRNERMEYLVQQFRQRFPQGSEDTIEDRRSGGHVILSLQTMGLPLADSQGRPLPRIIHYWLDQGVDYFHVASSDIFHERRRPDYPWEVLHQNLQDYGAENNVQFLIYGKGETRLVPSGRVLNTLPELEQAGASLLLSEGYCASSWEAASNFLSGIEADYPHCSEVVTDPHGWVHPCCWYELSPGLFSLTEMSFAAGMNRAKDVAFCQSLDKGDMLQYAGEAGIDLNTARSVRDKVGDCGVCRLASLRLTLHPEYDWVKVPEPSEPEVAFYENRLSRKLLEGILPNGEIKTQGPLGSNPDRVEQEKLNR